MKIAKTYAFYSMLILSFVLILMTTVLFVKKIEEQQQIKQEQISVFERYQAVLKLENSLIKKTTFDYSFWDELVDFAQKPDKEWSKNNLEPILKTFNASYIYVFNEKKQRIYDFHEKSVPSFIPDLASLSIDTPQFKEFFELHDGRFIKFFLAPIHPSFDLERVGKPMGFFLIGRIWDDTFLESMEQITLGKASLSIQKEDASTNTMHFYMPLSTLSEETIGYLHFYYTPSVLLFISELQNSIAIAGIIITIIAILLFYLLTKSIIFKPIHYISMALKTHHLSYIFSLAKQDNELGEIAHLICEHEKQKQLLEHYKEAIDENTILSKTDKNGLITYANDQFLLVSGYSRDELIGKPHNIVRHPDNPLSFFQEMWTTLKNGETWKGIIKNRRKDGTPYYVKSVIMPLYDKNQEIEEYIAICYDVSDLFEQVEHLRKETPAELPNRKMLFEKIELAKEPHLVILNVCDFREINTMYGQAFGDQYLNQLAMKIKQLAPASWILFHLQGDEFALLCDDAITQEAFTEKCQNILTILTHEGLFIEDKYYAIALRIGIANGSEYLYNRAEIAMKEARDTHKAMIIYDDNEGFKQRLEKDIEWNQTIRKALMQNRFTIFLQEIVPIQGQNLERKKYEVLIRLIDETGRIISPFHFIDLSKRMHIYDQLTRFVLQEGIRAALELHCDISINITQEDIFNQETITLLFDLMNQYPTLKDRITLELVESEGIEDSKEVYAFLQKAHAHGCLLAIDDFGAGYSNFEYLLRLAVNFIKIDGSLIKNLDTDANAYTTVKAITHFAKNLGILVVAEFVHKKEILDRVEELGIDFAQGYYLHEPSPKPKL